MLNIAIAGFGWWGRHILTRLQGHDRLSVLAVAEPDQSLHADIRAMGAEAVKVGSIAELEAALAERAGKTGPYVVVIDTNPYPSTPHGGHWWDVAVPEVSNRREVQSARAAYDDQLKARR